MTDTRKIKIIYRDDAGGGCRKIEAPRAICIKHARMALLSGHRVQWWSEHQNCWTEQRRARLEEVRAMGLDLLK